MAGPCHGTGSAVVCLMSEADRHILTVFKEDDRVEEKNEEHSQSNNRVYTKKTEGICKKFILNIKIKSNQTSDYD